MSTSIGKMVTDKELQVLFKVSRQTLYRWRKIYPDFPAPFRIGLRAIRYDLRAIEAFIDSRAGELSTKQSGVRKAEDC